MNAWANAMLLWSWQSLWIVAVTAVALKAVRLKSASVRHWIWLFATAVIAFLPTANVGVQTLEDVPAAVASIMNITAITAISSVTSIASLTSITQLPSAAVIEPAPTGSPAGQTSAASVFFGLWGLGVLISGALVFRNWRRARRIVAAAEISQHSDVGAPIRYSKLTSTPMIVGLLRPVIVLPADIHEWSTAEESRAMVAHEMAHLKRRDHYVGVLQAALGAACFFHPAVRYALREVAVERELACDEAVLASGVSATLYGDVLLRVAERSVQSPHGYSPSFGATGKVLERRIHMIFNHRDLVTRNPKLAWPFKVGGAFAMLVLALLVLPQRDTLAQSQDAPPEIRLAVNPLGFALMLAPVVTEAAAEPAPAKPPSPPAQGRVNPDLVAEIRLILAPVGSLSGTIVDPSGGFIPGVTVTLTSAAGGAKTVVTNASGLFEFQQIDPGRYTLRANLPGFLTVERSVFLTDGTTAIGEITLPLGGLSTIVSVSVQRPTRVNAPATASRGLGGNISYPNLISAPKPNYPPAAWASGAEGLVQLLGMIGRDGAVTSLQVDPSQVGTGNPDLVKAAMDAVQQWRYRPGTLNGQPIEMMTTIRVHFTMVE